MALPLPYRPLELKANGIYDPVRGTFYPWNSKNLGATGTLLPAKPKIAYFIHTVRIVSENHGDHAVSSNNLSAIVRGIIHVIECYAGTTTEASGVSSCDSLYTVVDMLCDVETSVTYIENCSAGYLGVLYAEIPVDEGEI